VIPGNCLIRCTLRYKSPGYGNSNVCSVSDYICANAKKKEREARRISFSGNISHENGSVKLSGSTDFQCIKKNNIVSYYNSANPSCNLILYSYNFILVIKCTFVFQKIITKFVIKIYYD